MADENAERVLHLLRSRDETLGTAESLTGGLLGGLLTAVPGASSYYVGGVIAYSSELKQTLLGVSPATVSEHGVVSAACAAEMAAGVRRATGCTWALSTTGVAGPEAQEGKPVGRVYVAVAGPRDVVRELQIEGDRAQIRRRTCHEAMAALIEAVGDPVGSVD